ncbi:hypothetical protein ACQPXM_03440 [Kribbella sp. CA-253562]|uniref:hypothetical protein n=1 Tax=Kribbella sp. CA-253562 TaxID=3239942 RepID=UPI003D89C883
MMLAAAVVLGILGINALISNALTTPASAGAGAGDVVHVGSDGYISPGVAPQTSEDAPTETWSPSPTEDETTTEPPAEPTPTPEPTLGNDLVSVAPEAAQDPATPVVVDLLTSYFTAINDNDYVTYQAQQTPAAQALMTRPKFATGFRSTTNSDVTLLSLTPTADGRRLAKITFTSNQDAADGPQGQTCTRWSVSKFLKGEPPTLQIDKAPKSYKATYAPC